IDTCDGNVVDLSCDASQHVHRGGRCRGLVAPALPSVLRRDEPRGKTGRREAGQGSDRSAPGIDLRSWELHAWGRRVCPGECGRDRPVAGAAEVDRAAGELSDAEVDRAAGELAAGEVDLAAREHGAVE